MSQLNSSNKNWYIYIYIYMYIYTSQCGLIFSKNCKVMGKKCNGKRVQMTVLPMKQWENPDTSNWRKLSLSISGQSHGLQPVLLFTCTLCWGTDCIWCIVCCRCGCRKQRLRLQQTAGTLTRNGNEQRRRKRTTLPPSRRKPSPVHQPKSRCHNLQTLSWLDLLSPPNHEKCSVVLSLTCITLNYLICCI